MTLNDITVVGGPLVLSTDGEVDALLCRSPTSGLAESSLMVDGRVVRVPKAYPVYDEGYEDALEVVKGALAELDNLHVVGRNGMHKYNNQDHAMLTAMLAVRNILGANHDVWSVNQDDEYHETVALDDHDWETELNVRDLASTQPLVPVRRSRTATTP